MAYRHMRECPVGTVRKQSTCVHGKNRSIAPKLHKMSVSQLKDTLHQYNRLFDESGDEWFVDRGIPEIEKEIDRRMSIKYGNY